MTDKESTILVMGPPGAGKSEFINRLAGSTKLQPNGVSTDSLRTISVSPYFTDDKTIKLVKFPGFDKSDTNLVDADLFIGIATFLGSYKERNKRIRSIIYLHPANVDTSKADDVDRNITMLEKLVQSAVTKPVKNVVVVSTGGQIPGTDDGVQSTLPDRLRGLGNGNPLIYDGTKLSVLIILENATKKAPILFDLKTRKPAGTAAGRELANYIDDKLIVPKEAEEKALDRKIQAEEDDEEEDRLKVVKAKLTKAVKRLKEGRDKLGNPIKWEQATADNTKLEDEIQKLRISATKDWMAEYDKIVKEKKEKVADYDKLVIEKNAKVAEYNELVKKNSKKVAEHDELLKILQTQVDFSVPIWADCDYAEPSDNFLSHSKGELFYTNGRKFMVPSYPTWEGYVARNSAGRVGAVWAAYFKK